MPTCRKAARAFIAIAVTAVTSIMAASVGTAAASAAPSPVVFTDAPGTSAPPSTLGPYTMTAFARDTQPVGEMVSSVTGPTGPVGFSPSLEHCLTPNPDGCWETWSNDYSGDVYATTSSSVTLTLPVSAKAFYFYAEPDEFMTFTMTATSDDGTSSGPISVAGFSGAEYFGFYSTRAASLKSITVTGDDPEGFAVGEFGISNCSYNTPASWTTKPVTELTPGVEPLNVVISGCSDVSLAEIHDGLADWESVPGWCLSPEQANVTGTYVNQQQSWRLESSGLDSGLIACAEGNKLSLTGEENHARLWNQPIPGTKYGAWFISASYETACVDIDNTMQPAKNYSIGQLVKFKLEGLLWHCIDGSQGSLGTDGYDRGAQGLVASIQAAAQPEGWDVNVQTIQTPSGIGEGHAGTGVPFNGTVYVVTIDHTAS